MIASNSKPRVTPKQLDRYDRERQLALKLALDLGDDRFLDRFTGITLCRVHYYRR